MKQLCYLSPSAAEHRWDALWAELDIVSTWYDTGQVKSLTAFVNREKTLYQQDFILFDLADQPWSNEHILSAVQMLRRFFVGHILFLSPENTDIKTLYGALANQFRVSGLMYENSETAEILRDNLLNPDGKKFAAVLGAIQSGVTAVAAQTVSPLNIPPGLVITIAVAGAMPRCGTSTQVFALWHYLSGLGFHPAIMDSTGRADALMEFFAADSQTHDGYTTMKGIPFCPTPVEDFNCYIVDAGVLMPNTAILQDADVAVVVGGTKPWELPPLAAALAYLKPHKALATLLSFSTEEGVQLVKPYLGKHYAMAAYHPDFLAPAAPAPYQAAILPCLKSVCGDKP